MQQGLPHELDHDASRPAPTAPMALGAHAAAWGAAGMLTLGLAGPVGLIGCAASPSRTQASADAAIEPVSAELPPPPTRRLPDRRPEKVVFSDEPDPDLAEPPTDAQSLAQGMPGGAMNPTAASGDESGLVEALAGSYDDDMKALAAMQADRKRAGAATSATADPAVPAFNEASGASAPDEAAPTPTRAATAREGTAPSPSAAVPVPPAASPATGPVATAPERIEAATNAVATSAVAPNAAVTDTGSATPTPAATIPAVPAKESLANTSLELPPAPQVVPTDPAELTRLLADSLAKRGASSTEPARDWLAYAALAIGEPSLSLPKDFGGDLLPAERERIEKAHAAFAAIGRLLAQGGEIDQPTAEGLVAALTGGPKLEIPKVEFCTKVESFGRYAPLGNDRFLARSNARFILYSELTGFSSELEDGEFVTRLATRVAIESERDGIEVWARQPAWTAVVDRSPTRREDFFVGEIVTVSEYLSVGSYRLKVEIRDEASGRVATAYHPLHVVADPSMAAVGD